MILPLPLIVATNVKWGARNDVDENQEDDGKAAVEWDEWQIKACKVCWLVGNSAII